MGIETPALNMQRMPQRPQRSLLHGLTQRGVRVNRAGHVFQRRARFQRVREGRAQLRHTGAHRLPADDAVVVAPGDDAHKAVGGFQCTRRIGGPRVRTIFNPFYKVADNLGSLFVAREEIAGDILVWNGDTLVSEALMAEVVANRDQEGICVTIDRKEHAGFADFVGSELPALFERFKQSEADL